MNTKKFLFYLLAGILGGCIPVMSLNPFYTEKNLTYDEKLLGTWGEDSNEGSWQFTDANNSKKEYNFVFTDEKGKKGTFIARLVKLEDKLFLDVYPDELPWEEKDPNKPDRLYNAFFLMPLHTIIRINAIEPRLNLQLTDDEELKKLLEDDPNAVEYTTIEDRLILTASTKELQAFVLKYIDDERLFGKEGVLTRQKAKEPQESAKQKSGEPNDPNKS